MRFVSCFALDRLQSFDEVSHGCFRGRLAPAKMHDASLHAGLKSFMNASGSWSQGNGGWNAGYLSLIHI